jgi:hypothetical protein
VRLSNIERSRCWINASYHTTNYSSGLISFGIPVSRPPGAPPSQGHEYPVNNSVDVWVPPVFSIDVIDPGGAAINITFYTNESGTWRSMDCNYTGVFNGTYTCNNNSWVDYNTTYWWNVSVCNAVNCSNKTYKFTTAINHPPNVTNEQPTNNSVNVSRCLNNVSVDINDTEGMQMSWSIYVVPGGYSASGDSFNGTINLTFPSCLDYNTTYTWYVNVTDNTSWTNMTFTFHTFRATAEISNPYPANNSINICPVVSMGISILHINGDNMTIQWLTNATGTWQQFGFNHSSVPNGTWYKIAPVFEFYNTTYYWRVNVTDSERWNLSSIFIFTTAATPSECECAGGSYQSWVIGLSGLFGILGFILYRRRK